MESVHSEDVVMESSKSLKDVMMVIISIEMDVVLLAKLKMVSGVLVDLHHVISLEIISVEMDYLILDNNVMIEILEMEMVVLQIVKSNQVLLALSQLLMLHHYVHVK
jgi:hypothetical protein